MRSLKGKIRLKFESLYAKERTISTGYAKSLKLKKSFTDISRGKCAVI